VKYYEEKEEKEERYREEVKKIREEVKGKKEKAYYKTYNSDAETLVRRLVDHYHSEENKAREDTVKAISSLMAYDLFREYFWRFYYFFESTEEQSLVHTLAHEKGNKYYIEFAADEVEADFKALTGTITSGEYEGNPIALVRSPTYDDKESVYNLFSLVSASPLILSFYGITKEKKRNFLTSYGYNHGNLLELYETEEEEILSLTTKLNISLTVGHALQSLHDKNVCRGYLTSEHVIIDNTGDDLEHAHFLLHYILPSQESKVEQSGDLASIIAPELREINPLTPDAWSTAGDVYSFGNFLWEIHAQTSIHEGEHDDEGIVIVPQDCPWRSIILQCWNQEPALRPTLNQVLDQLSEIRLSLRVVLGCNC